MLRTSSVILLFITILTSELQSQTLEEKDFVVYSTKEGLSSKKITAITNDQYGFIWIATEKGLNRFDGTNFKQFYTDTTSNSLPSDFIKALSWMSETELGAITSEGLHIINTTSLQGRTLKIKAADRQHDYIANNIYAAMSDKDGNKFCLSATGFYHFNKKDHLVFRYDNMSILNSEVPFGRIHGICLPEPNIVLVSTTQGPYIYHSTNHTFKPISKTDTSIYGQIRLNNFNMHFMHQNKSSFSVQQEGAVELSFFDIQQQKKIYIQSFTGAQEKFNWRSRIIQINDSTYAITAKEKGFYLAKHDKRKSTFNIRPELYFENYQCRSLFLDKYLRLWIGTNKGVFYQKGVNQQIEKISFTPEMNPSNRDLFTNMVSISKGKIFVGSNGAGMLVFNQKTGQSLAKIDLSKYATMGNYVYNTVSLNEDTVLAGIGGALVWIHTSNYSHGQIKLPNWNNDSQWVAALYKDKSNNIYICPNRNNEFYIRRKNAAIEYHQFKSDTLFNILVSRSISEDASGNLWFAGHGLSRYNVQKGRFDKRLATFPFIKNNSKQATLAQLDKAGCVYVGIKNNGLIIYNTTTDKFEQFTRNEGLPDNDVKSIYLHDSTLWIGTESGLASMNVITRKISSFGLSDDFPDEPFTAYQFLFDSSTNMLYAGFNNSIVRFRPSALEKKTTSPIFLIENITVAGNNTILLPTDTIILSHKNNTLVFQLASINFNDPQSQQFAYRLYDDINTPWQHLGKLQQFILSDLPPGIYRLQVKAFINNNSWPPQIRSLFITIKAPFWQTNWFWLLMVASTCSFIYYLYRLRIKSIRHKANIDKQMAELEIRGLHAQMNPHFIFNALNSIKEMILKEEKHHASKYLSKFAQLIRTSLEQSSQTFITISQCTEHLKQYLEMEKLRFNDFHYSITIDKTISADEERIAPMLVQPLVENAIWHGLRRIETARQLKIRFIKKGQNIFCEVDDNGVGIGQTLQEKKEGMLVQRSIGIINIRERLQVLNEKYQMNCSLEITDKKDIQSKNERGTLAILQIV